MRGQGVELCLGRGVKLCLGQGVKLCLGQILPLLFPLFKSTPGLKVLMDIQILRLLFPLFKYTPRFKVLMIWTNVSTYTRLSSKLIHHRI